jgi:Mlc titration factor MtfA (ptsG expression regulator)
MFWFKKWRRERLANRQFPEEWLRIIEKNVPLYNGLPSEDKTELRHHILIFVGEKRFEGCRGLEITDEIKVTIAAQACVLLLHRKTDYYPGLSTILVYPRAFVIRRAEHLPGGVVAEVPQVLLGESWHRGPVVLSWDDVKHDTADINDGHNVVFHEFAHQIESSGGKGDDTIVLKSSSSYIAWARVLQKDYEKLRQAAAQRQPTLLNKYGATNPAEFFAVVTEFFFEKPKELKEIHPQLYNELKQFYQQDPVSCLT